MERMNEFHGIGTVGSIKAGDKHVYMAVALNEDYKAKGSDEWTKKVVWLDTVAFGLTKDKVTKAGIQVGDVVLIIGKLDQKEYEGKKTIQVLLQKVQLISKSNKKQFAEEGQVEEFKTETTPDDDLPF